ncbi:glycosyl transferase family 2 [Tamlana sedimentorum]|uniref:Glycosyl transferase family 2 n=1 Tax=Neotamlana sedimentorum TaxID=1435349 RepID=A0A0D7WB62_9FLAO|nr:glycosyltransferase family A protein [Tamlana sedimentorum]KJD35928.1 glycosyl transferase family 2 [Tamlana sedimentorum]
MSVLVSIIVPCYNQAHYLSEALQSVSDQTYTNWECIVVNDGSPDNTEQITKQWLEKDARFKYVYQENGGLSSARNFGIKNSLGVFILPLDADDILHPDYLKKTVPVLNKNSDLGIVSCYRYFFVGNKLNIIKECKASGSNYVDILFENKLVCSSIYRRTCWDEVGGYDETMKKGFEDWEFWLNVTKRGWKFQIVEAFLFYYRKAKKSMLVDTVNIHSEASMEYIFRKHKELYTKHFDNTAKVLFYYIKTHRLGKMKIKNSLEYKIGKGVMKPFRIVYKLLSQANKKE